MITKKVRSEMLATYEDNCLEMEEWKHIDGFNGQYKVSNFGRIKSCGFYKKARNGNFYFVKERILIPSITEKGMVIHIGHGKRMGRFVHQLVAKAFIPNGDNEKYVIHKDGDITNNKVDNLKWSTRSTKSVICVDKNGKQQTFRSVKEAGEMLGLDRGNICKNIHGKIRSCGGYSFSFLESEE